MRIKENNFIYLLGGLLITLLIGPLIGKHLPALVSSVFALTMVLGVFSLAKTRTGYVFGWILAIIAMVLSGVGHGTELDWPLLASGVTLTLFLALSTVLALRQVLFDERMDANRIVGAVCVYLMFGLNWALIYWFIEIFAPGAFTGLPVAGAAVEFYDLAYYSFVTLTTLGYGDILPIHPAARAVAYLEAAAGVLYVAILVAALVGAYASAPAVEASEQATSGPDDRRASA